MVWFVAHNSFLGTSTKTDSLDATPRNPSLTSYSRFGCQPDEHASNNRAQGTPEEYKATVQGYIGYFGSYAFNGTDLVFHIEGSSFPNWNGTDQKRTNVTITGDELKYSQPTPSAGGPPIVVVWKRAK
jgi:hypothetical protein